MGTFFPAYEKTNVNEGGFANNPADKGGMTVFGIARNYHPSWAGWKLVDQHLKCTSRQPGYGTPEYKAWVRNFNAILGVDKRLKELRAEFYEVNFWKANRLDEVNDQAVAEWIYDHAVNGGARGVMWAQLAAKVKPDGEIGAVSLAAINGMAPAEFLCRAADVAGAYRLDRGSADPSQLQFLTSWLRRDGQPQEIIDMVKKAAADGRLDDTEVAQIKAAMAALS